MSKDVSLQVVVWGVAEGLLNSGCLMGWEFFRERKTRQAGNKFNPRRINGYQAQAYMDKIKLSPFTLA